MKSRRGNYHENQITGPADLRGYRGGVGLRETANLESPTAPYANAYAATPATAARNTLAQGLQTGQKIQGLAVPVRDTFGALNVQSLEDAQPVEIEKTPDGYTLRVAGQEVPFTEAELQPDGYYELRVPDGQGGTKWMGDIFTLTQEATPDALASTSSSMVPLAYSARAKSDGTQATVDDSDSSVQGYTIIGLETSPSDMPKTGTAQYSGFGRVDAYIKEFSYDNDDLERISYQGDAELNADFGAGKISGTLALQQRRETFADSGSTAWVDRSPEGGQLMLEEADIIDNGFSSNISANAAAEAMLDSDGIDVEAEAVGRFYGTDAGEVGAVIAGDGSHVINGVIAAERNP